MSTPQILPSDRRNGPAGLSTTLNDGWRKYGGNGVATYVSATTFTVDGDRTADFTKGRVLRIYHATSAAYKYVVVVSSAYTTLTTVTVTGDTLLNETYSSIWIDLSPVSSTNFLYRLQAMLDTPGALAQGDLLYINSASQLKKLSIGNTGEVLTTDSSGVPNWLPTGFSGMLNGKILTSVSSNNLTVAIKGLDGNDPSTTNPVYVKIGSTIRAITAALSVTKNAGTNWFGSGSTTTATLEVDYFVALIWNTTATPDAVTIGFARIPNGELFSGYSSTSTNQTYMAYSGSDAPASTDELVFVGRFNAILSATASFNWSIPATSIIIQHPITNSRWLTWTPAYEASGAMTYTSVTTHVGVYKVSDRKEVEFILSATGTAGGVASTTLRATTPLNFDDANYGGGACTLDNSTALAGPWFVNALTGTGQIGWKRYDGSNFTLAAGAGVYISGGRYIVAA